MSVPAGGASAARPESSGMSAAAAKVPGMTLEERVAVLEHDVAVLRSETRGWAEVAVSARSQAESAREMMTLIYHEIIGLKGVQNQHTQTLDRHTQTLDRHTQTLDQHTVLLHEILERLPPRSA